MRILLLNPNQINRFNWGHQLFKNEIGRQHEVTYYGEGFPEYRKDLSIPKYIEKMKRKGNPEFDLIITYESKWMLPFQGIEDINIPKAHIVIDYHDPKSIKGFSNWQNVDKHLKRMKPDIIFARSGRYVENLKRNLGVEKIFFLPFSVETTLYKNMNLNRNIDVMASFTNRPDVYPLREKIQTMLNKMSITTFTKKVIHHQYINTLNQSKIFVNSGGDGYSPLTMKFTEVLACGTLLITDKPEDMQPTGFKNGEHFVVFKDLEDLKKKINYYVKHEKERKNIALRGMKFVHANHNNEIRVKQFIDKIREEIL
jgi:spore maturation protein CgeB